MRYNYTDSSTLNKALSQMHDFKEIFFYPFSESEARKFYCHLFSSQPSDTQMNGLKSLTSYNPKFMLGYCRHLQGNVMQYLTLSRR